MTANVVHILSLMVFLGMNVAWLLMFDEVEVTPAR